MLKIAICDDEQFFVDEIEKIIVDYLENNNITYNIFSCTSGHKLLKKDVGEFDLIFLDMEMPGIDGMSVARKLRDQRVKAEIVFVTAFIKYSLQGYHVGAFRYIIKDNGRMFTIQECLDAFFKLKSIKESIIELFVDDGVKKVHTSSVVFIESFKHNLVYHIVEDNKINIYNVRGRVADCIEFKKYGIFQVHKSTLVNFDYVESVERYKLMLKNNFGMIDIGQPRYDEVYSQYINYKCRGVKNA